MCPVFVSSELLLSTHLPTEGWTAKLTVGLLQVVPTVGLQQRTEDLTRFATLRLNHSATTLPSVVFQLILGRIMQRLVLKSIPNESGYVKSENKQFAINPEEFILRFASPNTLQV